MDMNAKQTILTRQLPKTGQTVSYIPKDDGALELGWWQGRLNANNKVRFILKTISGDDIVIDRATGLMWAADGLAAGCDNGGYTTLTNAILYAINLNFAGFANWRVPNLHSLSSIMNFSMNTPAIDETIFPNMQVGYYHSSTTNAGNTTEYWAVRSDAGDPRNKPKGSTFYLRCVRSL